MHSLFRSCWIAGALALAGFSAFAAEETPRRGGVLVFASTLGEPDSYDCHGATSLSSLYRLAPHYSTLLKIDSEKFPDIVGDVAESWKVSPDGKRYEFRLRPNVFFHDGSALTSADVKATFERLYNPPEGVVSVRREQLRDITSIETPDPQTVVFHLGKPNASMLTMFAGPWNCIYSAKKLAEDPRYYSRNVMGTGPFKFVKHDAGSEWAAERFDKYFVKGKPYLDGLRHLNMTLTAAVNSLAAGQLHTLLGSLNEPDIERIVASRGDQVRSLGPINSMTLFNVTINVSNPVLNDVRVRQALNLAIDRRNGSEQIRKLTYISGFGGFLRTGSIFARSEEELKLAPGFRPDMEANRAEARRLLAEAGQKDLKLTFMNRTAFPQIGIFLIDQWRQIGVTVTHELPENKLFFERSRAGNYDLQLGAFAIYADDPELQFGHLVSYSKNKPNISRNEDPIYDELYEKQLRSTDLEERKKIVRQLEDRVLNNPSFIPLFWNRRYGVESVEVRGNYMLPSYYASLDFSTVWLAK